MVAKAAKAGEDPAHDAFGCSSQGHFPSFNTDLWAGCRRGIRSGGALAFPDYEVITLSADIGDG